MADLTELDRSESVKIVGASPSTGVPSNYLNVDTNGDIGAKITDGTDTAAITPNGDLQAADLLNTAVVQTIVSVPTGTIVAARVGASNLANRKLVIIQANVANMVYGFSATLTPFSFPLNSTFTIALGPNTTLYVGKTGTGAGNFSIAELS